MTTKRQFPGRPGARRSGSRIVLPVLPVRAPELMIGLPALLITVLALCTAPSAAVAQQATNPLVPGLPQEQLSTPTTTVPTVLTSAPGTSTTGTSFSGSSAVAISVGAIVVLTGISFFIWRDARRRAPVRHRAAAATAGSGDRTAAKQKVKPRKLSPAERRRRKRGRAR